MRRPDEVLAPVALRHQHSPTLPGAATLAGPRRACPAPGASGRWAVLHAGQNKFYPVVHLDDAPDAGLGSRVVLSGRRHDTARLGELFAVPRV